MIPAQIRTSLEDIRDETDPTLKNLKLASLVSAVFREEGVELTVVGGSAIEFYTEGAYVSGDVDFCIQSAEMPVSVRRRQEIMGRLGGVGGPRSWLVADGFVDVLGPFENLARTPCRVLQAPHGEVRLAPVEELIVERVLVAKYPQDYPPAQDCARKLLASALLGEIETNWAEVRRLALHGAYQNWTELKTLVNEQSETLKIRSPYNPD